MKHTRRETAILIGWTLLAGLFGLYFYPLIQAEEFSALEQVSLFFVITAAILIGAMFWYLIIKLKSRRIMTTAYAFGFVMMYVAMIDALFPTLQEMERIIIFGSVMLFGFIYYYDFLGRLANAPWTRVNVLTQYNNAFTIIALAFISISIGKSLSEYIAMALFFVIAIYDGLAVWKLKTMQAMALGFLKHRVIPGIAIAKKQKEKFAILGGGDIFFMILVPAAIGGIKGIGAGVALFLSIVILFMKAEKKKFYPALPFMFLGLTVYLIGWWLWGVLS